MLCEVARHEARLAAPAKDGKAQREHLESLARRGHAGAQRELEGPPMPPALAYLYTWYLELDAARPQGMAGPAPLAYADLAAWAALTGRHPAPHEVEALLLLDRVQRSALREAMA